MGDFYEEINKEPIYTKVLKKAKLKMISENMHPCYWSGFVYQGF